MKYKLVIDDVDKAHETFVDSYKNFPHVQQRVKNGPKRQLGTVHTTAESDCPVGMPNCRNCGDPNYKEQCSAAGHCPDCGTKHGIAPDSVINASGYKLVTE
jgi:hypothetical protein